MNKKTLRTMLRKRSANFNPRENQILFELVNEKAAILQIKQCNSTISNMKNKAWREITMRFNAHEDIQEYRCEKVLRKKYANEKSIIGDKSTSCSPRNEAVEDESVATTSDDVFNSTDMVIKQEKTEELEKLQEFFDKNPLSPLSTENTNLHVIDFQCNQRKHSASSPVVQPATKRVKWIKEKIKMERKFLEEEHKERLRLMRDKDELEKEKLKLELELLKLKIANEKKKLESNVLIT